MSDTTIPRADFSIAPGEEIRLNFRVRNRAGVGIETTSGAFEARWELRDNPEGDPIRELTFDDHVYASLEVLYTVVVHLVASTTEDLLPGIYTHTLWTAVGGLWKISSRGTLRISGAPRGL